MSDFELFSPISDVPISGSVRYRWSRISEWVPTYARGVEVSVKWFVKFHALVKFFLYKKKIFRTPYFPLFLDYFMHKKRTCVKYYMRHWQSDIRRNTSCMELHVTWEVWYVNIKSNFFLCYCWWLPILLQYSFKIYLFISIYFDIKNSTASPKTNIKYIYNMFSCWHCDIRLNCSKICFHFSSLRYWFRVSSAVPTSGWGRAWAVWVEEFS